MSTVRVLEGLAASHREVEAAVAALDETSLRAASARPGWSRHRVVADLAGHVGDLPAAVVLLEMLRRHDATVEAGLADLAAEPVAGDTMEAALSRWREVVAHHTDLGVGYGCDDWPADYVRLDLERMTMRWSSRRPMGLTGLPEAALRLPTRQRLAWLLGRVDVDGLVPEGVW